MKCQYYPGKMWRCTLLDFDGFNPQGICRDRNRWSGYLPEHEINPGLKFRMVPVVIQSEQRGMKVTKGVTDSGICPSMNALYTLQIMPFVRINGGPGMQHYVEGSNRARTILPHRGRPHCRDFRGPRSRQTDRRGAATSAMNTVVSACFHILVTKVRCRAWQACCAA